MSETCRNVPKSNQKMSKNTANTPKTATELPEVDLKIEAEKAEIVDFLWDGAKKTAEIIEGVSRPEKAVRRLLGLLEDEGIIVKVKSGLYRLSAKFAPWTEQKNEKIIDSLMKLYEKVLEQHFQAEDISLNDFKSLILMADRLMKRWYLVHRGYDTNTRQAAEDAKKKTVEREKQETENAPPEDQVVVIREYDETMREVLAKLPGKELKERAV